MTIQVGDRVPNASFRVKTEEGIKEITTDELFKGKKVVLFSVPGAFTPTCSAKHLPGFVQKAADFQAKGIDTIACMAVNDAFVMDAWGRDQQVGEKVKLLADGNATFAKALGLELDATGVRSEEHTSELQSLMRISYAVFCLINNTYTSDTATQ